MSSEFDRSQLILSSMELPALATLVPHQRAVDSLSDLLDHEVANSKETNGGGVKGNRSIEANSIVIEPQKPNRSYLCHYNCRC
jgi:hypothetical protein